MSLGATACIVCWIIAPPAPHTEWLLHVSCPSCFLLLLLFSFSFCYIFCFCYCLWHSSLFFSASHKLIVISFSPTDWMEAQIGWSLCPLTGWSLRVPGSIFIFVFVFVSVYYTFLSASQGYFVIAHCFPSTHSSHVDCYFPHRPYGDPDRLCREAALGHQDGTAWTQQW